MKKALVLSLAVVLGLGVASFAQTLSGSWDTTVTIQPSPVTLGIDSTLIVTYAVSGWSFTSDSVLDESGWQSQAFTVDGALGAFTLGSEVEFETIVPAFDSMTVNGGLSLAGVTFNALFVLTTDVGSQTPSAHPNDTALILTGAGTAGTVNVSATLKLGSAYHVPTDATGGDEWYVGDDKDLCDFDFNGVTIDVGFPFCCATISSEINFTCTGFQYVWFKTSGIAIPNLPWMTLAAKLNFTTSLKTLTLSPSFNFGAIACFNLYIAQLHSDGVLPTSFLSLGDIVIQGIGLTCDIGGVEFKGISWIANGDPQAHGSTSMPADLTVTVGSEDKTYWEMYQISTTDDGCCGPFDFSIGVYFKNGGAKLFDVSLFKADMSIQVATQFTFSTGIIMDLEPTVPGIAFTQWTIGFKVEW